MEDRMDQAITGSRPAPPMLAFAIPLAMLLAAAEVLADWGTWIQLNVAILYSLPLLVAALARDRKLLWGLATTLVLMTFGVYFAQVDGGPATMRTSFFIDRLLAAICILLNAGILDAWMGSVDRLVSRDRAIAAQNEELERQRMELEQAGMRKTQMLASLSHDIRTPIQAITLLSELMRRTAERPELAEKIPALARRLESNAMSVVDFLSEVIDVASFDSGRIAVNSSEFSLHSLIAEQRERLQPLADVKSIELAAHLSPQPLCLFTDRAKLGRVITNLVGNAIKFTDKGAVVIAVALLPDGGIAISIADTGCGMRREHLERVFGEYAQLKEAESLAATGWGLGLAISRRMVRLLGGEISVKSELNVGSTFTVVLPAACLTREHA
jgi:signal transduction histidine kinase